MNKAVGWAIGGAVLSITAGVVVGLVLHVGQMERADRLPQPTSSLSARVTQTGESTGPAHTGLKTAPAPGTAATSSTTPPESTPPESTPPESTPPTDLSLSPSSSARVSQTGESTGPTNTGPAETASSTPTPGRAVAGQPCPALAAGTSDAAGTTLYCQVDQADRTLRWRAVVDKGGCLSQRMTGVAADGRTYQCRLDGSGRNHWAPTG